MLFYVEAPDAAIPPTGRPNLIVTLAIGEPYLPVWEHIAKPTWMHYAEKCNADIIAITKPLDTSARAQARSPAWQKLLVLNQPWARQYQRVLWLDSDIVISPSALNVFDYAPDPEKISLCRCGDRMSAGEKQIYLEHLHKARLSADYTDRAWAEEIIGQYDRHDVPQHDEMFNTGVMVLSSEHHNDLFLKTYEHPDKSRLYEQPWLSHEIIEHGLAHILPARFNWGIHDTLYLYMSPPVQSPQALHDLTGFLVERELANAYFLHFYGSMNLLQQYMPAAAA